MLIPFPFQFQLSKNERNSFDISLLDKGKSNVIFTPISRGKKSEHKFCPPLNLYCIFLHFSKNQPNVSSNLMLGSFLEKILVKNLVTRDFSKIFDEFHSLISSHFHCTFPSRQKVKAKFVFFLQFSKKSVRQRFRFFLSKIIIGTIHLKIKRI